MTALEFQKLVQRCDKLTYDIENGKFVMKSVRHCFGFTDEKTDVELRRIFNRVYRQVRRDEKELRICKAKKESCKFDDKR